MIMRISIVGIPWYERADYDSLRRIFIDRDKLPELFDQWLQLAEDLLNQFRKSGQAFRKVPIDPATFPAWCANRGLNIDAKARIEFANEWVAGKHTDPDA
jgi:hypothetical protein